MFSARAKFTRFRLLFCFQVPVHTYVQVLFASTARETFSANQLFRVFQKNEGNTDAFMMTQRLSILSTDFSCSIALNMDKAYFQAEKTAITSTGATLHTIENAI